MLFYFKVKKYGSLEVLVLGNEREQYNKVCELTILDVTGKGSGVFFSFFLHVLACLT